MDTTEYDLGDRPRITIYANGYLLYFVDNLSKLSYKQPFKLIEVIKMWDEEDKDV